MKGAAKAAFQREYMARYLRIRRAYRPDRPIRPLDKQVLQLAKEGLIGGEISARLSIGVND